MRSASYRPHIWGDKIVIDCPCENKGGPCWGATVVVDEVHTESQYLEIWACKGHAEVALTGKIDDYKYEIPEDILQMEKEVAQAAKWFGRISPVFLIFSIICFSIERYLLGSAFLYGASIFVSVWCLTAKSNR